MGLFDKLFDKKECAICGREIGLMGNRKLADGNLCKECAKQLSPWMTDRRESTVEEIRRHLAYRAENARLLPGVRPTRVFGSGTKVYLDENTGRFFVTAHSNYLSANPDVISVSQVIDCKVNVKESRQELYHNDREGRRVPYNPPRYKSEYRFFVTIHVDSPYFNEIEFELSDARPDSPLSDAYRAYEQEARALQDALNPANYAPRQAGPQASAVFQNLAAQVARAAGAAGAAPKAEGKTWKCACGSVNQGNFCGVCGRKRPVVYRCDKCGWMPQDQNNLPKFCPQCGDPFNAKEDAQ